MKVFIVSDSVGAIAAIVPQKDLKPQGKDAPSGVSIVPYDGQVVEEIDLPADLAKLPFREIAQNYLLRKGKLVKMDFEEQKPGKEKGRLR